METGWSDESSNKCEKTEMEIDRYHSQGMQMHVTCRSFGTIQNDPQVSH